MYLYYVYIFIILSYDDDRGGVFKNILHKHAKYQAGVIYPLAITPSQPANLIQLQHSLMMMMMMILCQAPINPSARGNIIT